MNRRVFGRFLFVAALILGGTLYAAADTTWNMSNVTFSDGAMANGWFTMDPTFSTVVDWNIWVIGSSIPGADYHYIPSDSNYFYPSSTFVAFASNPFAEYLVLFMSSPMTNAGGTIPIPGSVDCNPSGVCGSATSGAVTTVPEPASMLLLASGASLLAAKRRRRA